MAKSKNCQLQLCSKIVAKFHWMADDEVDDAIMAMMTTENVPLSDLIYLPMQDILWFSLHLKQTVPRCL